MKFDLIFHLASGDESSMENEQQMLIILTNKFAVDNN